MKINCPCGALIVDTTDFLSYKARRVADRDWEDLLFADDDVDAVRNAYMLSRSMWQCTRCGRLCLDDRDHRLHWFVPDDPDALPRRLLSSVHGTRWKGHLRGHWNSDTRFGPSGRLWWSCGDGDEGREEPTSRAELERRYDEEFARLHDADLLRSALLRVGGCSIRSWPARDASSSG